MASQESGSNISVEKINTGESSTMQRAINDYLDSSNNIDEVSITIEMGEGRLHKVPKTLMKQPFLEFFEPRVVSLGPYHHNVEHLQITADDKHKIKYYLLQGQNKKAEDFDNEKMNIALKDARHLYVKDNNHSMSSEEFNDMMILDACFIIHIIDYIGDMKEEGLGIKRYLLPLVVEDIFLLENQVPFAVLEAAMNSLGKNPEEMTRRFFFMLKLSEEDASNPSFFHKIYYSHWIIWCILVVPMLVMCIVSLPKIVSRLKRQWHLWHQKKRLKNNRKCFWKDGKKVHLLQILRAELLSYEEEKKPEARSNFWQPTRCATELKAIGINFQKGENRGLSLKDVKFEEGPIFGQLFLPSINRFTKHRLLNLMSYELSLENCGYGITSYVSFLDGLIDRPEDVKELRSKNILPKGLGSDEEVARFFNKVGTDLAPKPLAYYEVWQDIEAHCSNTGRVVIADICDKYFGNYLRTISFFIAIFLFVITLAQAYTTFFPTISNKENHILSVFSYLSLGFSS